MRLRELAAAGAFLALTALSAKADSLVDITITGDGHTASLSVPAIYTLQNPGGHPYTPDLPATTTGTVDKVSGNPVFSAFYFSYGRSGGGATFQFQSAVPDYANLDLRSISNTDSIMFLPGTTATTYILGYIPGTYNWIQAYGDSSGPIGGTPFTVTIAAEATTPEPATWTFVATGLLGLGLWSIARSRRLPIIS